jgi:biopolymer transport protein TolQ|tara:strand:+ start:2898 stop:3587 length:690 start_codon:yes stop_codon:yes gene_type:complete
LAEENLSIIYLIINASLLVQFVMALLLLASVTSWVMIVQRGISLRQSTENYRNFEDTFWSGQDLNIYYEDLIKRVNDGEQIDGIESVFEAGFKEYHRLVSTENTDSEMIIEAVDRSMRIALARENEKLSVHLPFLASVASVSPYVGLFGTVWGIMNSFRGLAMVQQATLATVAPGISEALIATAMGLFAAIPAVLAYNRFSSKVDELNSNYETFAEEFSSILNRQLHAR